MRLNHRSHDRPRQQPFELVQKLFPPGDFAFIGVFDIGKTELLILFHVRYLENKTVAEFYRSPVINQRFLSLKFNSR